MPLVTRVAAAFANAGFWAVALVSLPDVPSARRELRVLRDRRVLLALLTNALVQGATFCTFTYLALLSTRVTGLDEAWVPGVPALFGAGAFAGVTLGGRIADAHPSVLPFAGTASPAVGWTALALAAGNPAVAGALVFVQGMLAFGTGPALIVRVLRAAAEAPTPAGGFATAAFNVGAVAGPWLGGVAIGAGLGFRSPVWVSVLLLCLAAGVLAAGVLAAQVRTLRAVDPVNAGR